jgi:hypothetical protein
MLIKKKDGTPFENERAAKMRAGTLKKKGLGEYKLVEVDGGWAIDDLQVEPPKEVQNETEESTVEFSGEWKQARLLSIIDEHKKPGRRYRWCNTKIEGNIEKKKFEGWVVDSEIYEKLKNLSLYKDNTNSLDTSTRIKELILMWIPEHKAIQRNKYYRDLANSKLPQSQKQLEAELRKGGGSMYGSLERNKEFN